MRSDYGSEIVQIHVNNAGRTLKYFSISGEDFSSHTCKGMECEVKERFMFSWLHEEESGGLENLTIVYVFT